MKSFILVLFCLQNVLSSPLEYSRRSMKAGTRFKLVNEQRNIELVIQADSNKVLVQKHSNAYDSDENNVPWFFPCNGLQFKTQQPFLICQADFPDRVLYYNSVEKSLNIMGDDHYTAFKKSHFHPLFATLHRTIVDEDEMSWYITLKINDKEYIHIDPSDRLVTRGNESGTIEEKINDRLFHLKMPTK